MAPGQQVECRGNVAGLSDVNGQGLSPMALPWDASLDSGIGDQDAGGKCKHGQMVFGGAESCPHHLG